MKHVLTYYALTTLLVITAGCVTSRFQPIQNTTSAITPTDSAAITVFLLERDLPPTFERLGTVAISAGQYGLGVHKQVEDELQKVGRQKGANGAIRIQHGTHELDRSIGIISYLLFRYPVK